MSHLILEVSVVIQDGPLEGAGPHVILEHVLLLGEVPVRRGMCVIWGEGPQHILLLREVPVRR